MKISPRQERLNADVLRPFVSFALGRKVVEIRAWDSQILKGSWSGVGNFVARLSGRAVAGGDELLWSVILKIPRPLRPERDRWQREPLMYGSGVLDGLPGPLEAPRCLGVEEVPGDEPWIWLVDVAGTPSETWPIERFHVALTHLGQCQGAYLCGRTLPEQHWFDTSWWLRKEAGEGHVRARQALAALASEASESAAARVFEGAPGEAVTALLDGAGEILDALERLPMTFTHGDWNPTNMIAPGGSDERTVVLNWHFSGKGVIGFDVVTFLGCAAVYEGPRLGRIEQIVERAIASYLHGLRKAGWEGDDAIVRLGVLGNLAVRVTSGLPRLVQRCTMDGPFQIRDPQSLAERMDHYAAALEHLLMLAKEARYLLTCVE